MKLKISIWAHYRYSRREPVPTYRLISPCSCASFSFVTHGAALAFFGETNLEKASNSFRLHLFCPTQPPTYSMMRMVLVSKLASLLSKKNPIRENVIPWKVRKFLNQKLHFIDSKLSFADRPNKRNSTDRPLSNWRISEPFQQKTWIWMVDNYSDRVILLFFKISLFTLHSFDE